MPDSPPDENLANYHSLLRRIEQHCGKITETFAEEITCRAGCSACCRHLTLFPVEAANLVKAVDGLPAEIRSILAGRVQWRESGSCPLLLDDRCTVYSARPVICRTHGLPLLAESEGVKTVDCCPENFRGVASLPGDAVIHLATLNSTLVAINAMFVVNNDAERFKGKDRFTIADIIQFSIEKEPV